MSVDEVPGRDRRSRLVLGSADLTDEPATLRLLDQFHAAGGRALDLANVYGDGESTRAVGKWLSARRSRDEVVLYAKGCHPPYCSPDLLSSLLTFPWVIRRVPGAAGKGRRV